MSAGEAECASLNAGVIGCGAHAVNVLLPSLREAGLQVTALCARTPSVARRVASLHGVARRHTRVSELCADPDVDAVVVAVPPASMESVLDVVLRSGKPAYIEKPAAPDCLVADRLAALAEAEGATTMVGYMKRFAPAYRELARLVAEGEVGAPSLVRIRWAMGPFGPPRGLEDWFFENAVHAVDLARWLSAPIESLQVQISGHDGQHVVLATGLGRGGLAISLTMCTTGPWWSDNEEVEVFGMGKTARVRNAVEVVHVTDDGVEHRFAPNFTIPVRRNATTTLAGFVPALEAFADVVRGSRSPCDLGDAAATLRLAQSILDTGRNR